jgi:hypothetical protein
MNLIQAVPQLKLFRPAGWMTRFTQSSSKGCYLVCENTYPYKNRQARFKVLFSVDTVGGLKFNKIVINRADVNYHPGAVKLATEIKEFFKL